MNQKLSPYLKAGLQGGTGTGKSMTSALILLGLSVAYHEKAPVLVRDSEPGWQWIKPMYEAEGVPLMIEPGRDFKGLHASVRRAAREGCCGFCADSLTHPWGELLSTFADNRGKVAFHKFNQIKKLWNEWTVDFLDLPLHAVVTGRLTWEYEYQEDEETGKKELVKGDSKMKAGGSESFGYEPHLSIEMYREQIREQGRLKGMQYVATVLKDRSRTLNGMEFVFNDIRNYKKGDYKHVLQAIKPHLDYMGKITGVTLGRATSAELVQNGNSEWADAQKQKKIAIEDFDETLEKLWPGTATDAKKARKAVCEFCFEGIRSRTEIESQTLEPLQNADKMIREFEKKVSADKMPDTIEGILNLLENVKQEIANEAAAAIEVM